jgi:hypothetical protein
VIVWLIIGMMLAIERITRLLVVDTLPAVRVVREWFVRTFGVINEDGEIVDGKGYRWARWLTFSIAYLWTCPWCMSPWVGLGLWQIIAHVAHLDVPYPWLVIAAASTLSGWMANLQGEHDQRWQALDIEINGRKRPT